MKIQEIKNKASLKVAGILLALVAAILGNVSPVKLGGAPSGLASTVASTSILAVGPQQNLVLFAETSNCAARVVSTVAKPIMLSFGSSPTAAVSDATTTVSAIRGHLQSASTTVTYDAGQYGCGYVGVYGHDASSTITISEFR